MSTINQLTALRDLLKSGAIDQNEFQRLKTSLIDEKHDSKFVHSSSNSNKPIKNSILALFIGFIIGAVVLFFIFSEKTVNSVTSYKPPLEVLYKIDTIQKINFNNEALHLVILRDRFDETGHLQTKFDECEGGDIKVAIINSESNKTILFKKIYATEKDYANQFKIYSSKSNDWFIEGIFNGCGSGTTGKLYQVNLAGNNLSLKELFATNNMQQVYFSNNNNEILIINFDWQTGEGHFDPHRCQIEKYSILDKQKKYLATTELRYDTDSKNILDSIFKNEAKLLAGIGILKVQVTSEGNTTYESSESSKESTIAATPSSNSSSTPSQQSTSKPQTDNIKGIVLENISSKSFYNRDDYDYPYIIRFDPSNMSGDGAMTLSHTNRPSSTDMPNKIGKSCNYYFVYHIDGNKISTTFKSSDCGNTTSDLVLTFNAANSTITMYAEGKSFVFTSF